MQTHSQTAIKIEIYAPVQSVGMRNAESDIDIPFKAMLVW
jgi:hypothetical protein